MGVLMAPAWAAAAGKVKGRIKSRYVPLMAIGAAFSFTIMMYNVPLPGGTTAHAVGGGLLAVVLGPWAAMICITIALAIQALLFGDGGVWKLTPNCLNKDLIMHFIDNGVYRVIGGKSELDSPRRWIGAAVGGYLGLCGAALCAGIELGLQPILFHTAAGVPLYCPYPLTVAIPAMLIGHLTVAGPLEAVVTGLVVRYLQTHSVDLLQTEGLSAASSGSFSYRKRWWALGAMVVLTPLGLLASGTAWGEWQTEELQKLVGFIPAGLQRMASTWSFSPLPDYSLPGFDSFTASAVIYIVSALVGVGIICLFTYFFGRLQVSEKNGRH
jgi:cobalt/nickel transport system permease protein